MGMDRLAPVRATSSVQTSLALAPALRLDASDESPMKTNPAIPTSGLTNETVETQSIQFDPEENREVMGRRYKNAVEQLETSLKLQLESIRNSGLQKPCRKIVANNETTTRR